MGDRDYLQGFLFHLGKGLWKSVPVLGPIVEEVLYEQFEDELSGRVAGLSDEDVEKLVAALPHMDMEDLDARIAAFSEENRLFAVQQMTNMLDCLKGDYERIGRKLDDIDARIAPVETIAEIVAKMQHELGSEQSLRLALDEIARKREAWVQRLSDSQRVLLDSIPCDYAPLCSLWNATQGILPNCGYKEFRFRLHELEWLGLAERYHDQTINEWMYRRSGTAREGQSHV